MRKRPISKKDYDFLTSELNIHKKNNFLSEEQVQNVLRQYQINSGISFVKVILTIGAILVGLGILSFIASNWDYIGKLAKFLIILISYLGVNTGSLIVEEVYPRISRSLTYLGLIIYGAGIFLVGQMFNYGGHFSSAFLLWGLGIFPIALLLKDKYIFTFASILFLIYLNGHFSLDSLPLIILLIVPVMYLTNKYFYHSKQNLFFINLLFLNTILFYLTETNIDEFFVVAIFFAIGMLMFYGPFQHGNIVFKVQGSVVIGIAGVMLTIPDFWNIFQKFANDDAMSITFAVAFIIYLLFLTKGGNLISLMFICITIFRFYFDTFYDFLPKSVFFIIGGLILLGFGYYFERIRKIKGVIVVED